jgi:hypothetical protein
MGKRPAGLMSCKNTGLSDDLGYMAMDILRQLIGRYIIFIAAERIFYFFGYQFQAGNT